MKTLLKISCVLAIALFVSMSLNAQTLPSQDLPGRITVDVPAFMTFTVGDIQDFVKPHVLNAAVTPINTRTNAVAVNSNVKWSVSIKADAAFLEGTHGTTDKIAVGDFAIELPTAEVQLSSLTAAVFTGQKNVTTNLVWNYSPQAINYFADKYSVNITYTLAQTAF